MKEERERVSLQDETFAAIEEARMVLPGIQALFGFQLIAVFNARFEQLQPLEQRVHLLALGLVAVSIALVMAPAAYHRIAERGWVSRELITLTSNLLSAGMLTLMLALSIEVGLVAEMVLHRGLVSLAIGLGLLVILLVLWFVLPWRRARRHRRT